MSANTSIEWADHTFNPWVGCIRVSPGCDNCYAAAQDKFRHWTPEGWGGPRKRTKTWGDPKKWNDQHAAFFAHYGHRQRVFCASLGDVFDNQVPTEWRMDLFKLIADTPNLDWLLLTKRIGNVMPMCSGDSLMLDMISERVWLGATVVNQEEADRDIPKLLAVPAAKRFLSTEPLLGPVNLRFGEGWCRACHQRTPGTIEGHSMDPASPCFAGEAGLGDMIDWVIVGGESGPGARPMHPDWARSLRDQCQAAGVPYLFKQWGEWLGQHQDGAYDHDPIELNATDGPIRVGKKAAGRLLDGIEHNGFPS